jgi:hypothetical protein
MAAVAIWRWVLLGLLSNPVLGFVWLLLAGLPFLHGQAFLPSSRGALALALEWSFPAGLIGVSASLVTLSHGGSFLARFAPTTRFLGELGALVLSALYLQLPVLAGIFLGEHALHDLGPALPAILTADLHLAGIALLLLLPSLSAPLRVSLFLALAWLVPALCSADQVLAHASVWLDAAAALRRGAGDLLAASAPATALVLTAYLLRTRPTPAPAG